MLPCTFNVTVDLPWMPGADVEKTAQRTRLGGGWDDGRGARGRRVAATQRADCSHPEALVSTLQLSSHLFNGTTYIHRQPRSPPLSQPTRTNSQTHQMHCKATASPLGQRRSSARAGSTRGSSLVSRATPKREQLSCGAEGLRCEVANFAGTLDAGRACNVCKVPGVL